MEKRFHHPRGVAGAVLVLVAAAVAFVLLVPVASGGSPSGANEVRGYENSKGDRTKKVGADELFTVVGKNFGSAAGHVTAVECWDPAAKAFVAVDSFVTGGDSKHLIVDAANTCISNEKEEHIRVTFNVKSPLVVDGPRLAIT
jgi:hypothetical protein